MLTVTIKDKPSLCSSCRYSGIRRTERGTTTLCEFHHPAIPVDGILECNDYKPFTASEPPWEFKDAAWDLVRKGDKIGFTPPKKEEKVI